MTTDTAITTILRARILVLERELELVGAANDALRAELAALRVGSMRGAAGLDGATAEAKRQRFMRVRVCVRAGRKGRGQ